MTLSSVIHLLRTEAHMTQEQLAVVLGVPPQAVQDWETGTKMPETENLVILSKYFNVSLDELVLSRDDTVHKHRRFRRIGGLHPVRPALRKHFPAWKSCGRHHHSPEAPQHAAAKGNQRLWHLEFQPGAVPRRWMAAYGAHDG